MIWFIWRRENDNPERGYRHIQVTRSSTRRRTSGGLMLGQRRRRYFIKPPAVKCLGFDLGSINLSPYSTHGQGFNKAPQSKSMISVDALRMATWAGPFKGVSTAFQLLSLWFIINSLFSGNLTSWVELTDVRDVLMTRSGTSTSLDATHIPLTHFQFYRKIRHCRVYWPLQLKP